MGDRFDKKKLLVLGSIVSATLSGALALNALSLGGNILCSCARRILGGSGRIHRTHS